MATRKELERRIRSHGYEVAYPDYCDDGEPGLKGRLRGVTDHAKKLVRISLNENVTADIVGTLAHALAQLDDPETDRSGHSYFLKRKEETYE